MSGAEHLGPYLLEVKEGVFPLGGDSLALGAFATVKRGWRVCDLGTGSRLSAPDAGGPGGGALSHGSGAGGAGGPVCPGEPGPQRPGGDGPPGGLAAGDPCRPAGSTLVISNPPYFQPGHGGDGGEARQADCSLEELCRTAARLLRNRGRFALCHRPERLADLMCALRGSGLEPKRMRLLAMGRSIPPPVF